MIWNTDFSGGRSGGLVLPSLSEFSTIHCDPHSQRLWHSQESRNKMFFWNSVAFLMIQWMLAIWSLVPLPFLKPVWTSRSPRFTYCWNLALRNNFEHYFTSVWDECSCAVVWAFFGIAFLWDCNENWPFPVLWPLLSLAYLLAYLVQYFDGPNLI